MPVAVNRREVPPDISTASNPLEDLDARILAIASTPRSGRINSLSKGRHGSISSLQAIYGSAGQGRQSCLGKRGLC